MSLFDCVNLISAPLAVATAVAVAFAQWRQGRQMHAQGERAERFERTQVECSDQRRDDAFRAEAARFLSKNHEESGLVPLCAIAAMHDATYPYKKAMYAEFCTFPKELQDIVLELNGVDLRMVDFDKDVLFRQSIDALDEFIQKRGFTDTSPFYDLGKYVERSLGLGATPLLHTDFEYGKDLTNILSEAFHDGSPLPFAVLNAKYNFGSASPEGAYQYVTTLARWLSNYEGQDLCDPDWEGTYGSPGSYAYETISTFEDLFLVALFEMYVGLILMKDGENTV